AHHVNRTAQLGSWVIAINGWYYWYEQQDVIQAP
ncbi:hypothetical protein ATR1_390d0002, partial [Acetobacter tropicalis]